MEAFWGFVEIMGHQRICGEISEEEIFGGVFCRVDVPATDTVEAFTKYFNHSAIYSITPSTEEMVRAAAPSFQQRPIELWQIKAMTAQLPGSSSDEYPHAFDDDYGRLSHEDDDWDKDDDD